MNFTELPLKDSYLISLNQVADNRGWFARTYCKDEFAEIGHKKEWVQLNHSVSYKKGTIRGIHYQLPPFTEVKLVRCIAGAIFDVIVDIRRGSATFLKWYGIELSAKNRKMIYIPEGFAHGFQTLSDNCELIYHHTECYVPDIEKGLRFDDTALNIDWPLKVSEISDRDKNQPNIDHNFNGITI
jgi:dTDP-4-dehydrorhamnose 3,5-epimerase